MGLWERHFWKDTMYIICIYIYIYIYIYLYHYHLSPYFLKGIIFSKVIYGIHYHTLVPRESISSYTKPRIYFACIEGQRANACRGQNLFEIWPNRNVPGRVQLASGLYFGSVVCYCVWNFSSSPHNTRHWIHHIHLKTFWNKWGLLYAYLQGIIIWFIEHPSLDWKCLFCSQYWNWKIQH